MLHPYGVLPDTVWQWEIRTGIVRRDRDRVRQYATIAALDLLRRSLGGTTAG